MYDKERKEITKKLKKITQDMINCTKIKITKTQKR